MTNRAGLADGPVYLLASAGPNESAVLRWVRRRPEITDSLIWSEPAHQGRFQVDLVRGTNFLNQTMTDRP